MILMGIHENQMGFCPWFVTELFINVNNFGNVIGTMPYDRKISGKMVRKMRT